MEENNTLFSNAYELTERSDGSKQPRLKQDTELRALLEGHSADEPGYETVVMFALFDASTPKGAQMNIKDEQEQFPNIVLDSYPCPGTAELHPVK